MLAPIHVDVSRNPEAGSTSSGRRSQGTGRTVRAVVVAVSDLAPTRLAAALTMAGKHDVFQPLSPRDPAGIIVAVGSAGLRSAARSLLQTIRQTITTPVWMGVGGPIAPLRSTSVSRREAERAAVLARTIGQEPCAVLYDDMLVADLLSRDPALRLRLAGLLDALGKERSRRTSLIGVLEALVAEGLSRSAAARRLGVHHHSLAYRERQAEHILGLSLRDPHERLVIETALVARRLNAAARAVE